MDLQARRGAVIALHLKKKRPSEIVRSLEELKSFVLRTINRYEKKGTIKDLPRSGRPATVSTPENRQKLRRLFQRKPSTSLRKAAKILKIGKTGVETILKEDMQMKPYKFRVSHGLTTQQKQERVKRCRKLLRRFANKQHEKIVFSDEKIFTVERAHNHQNDRIWSTKLPGQSATIERRQRPKYVMVWAGITASGKTPLVFIDLGVKINQEVYQKTVLEKALVPWARRHFGESNWVFQQDSAPSHAGKSTQNWMRANLPDFITKDEWPANSPDLNPMDYSIWSILEGNACAVSHDTREGLIASLKKEWKKIPAETIAKVVDDFPRRLRACIKAGGGHFEA